jgi:4-amino-4-deoxy-L-arabinose transferase-like glycosyltransferase
MAIRQQSAVDRALAMGVRALWSPRDTRRVALALAALAVLALCAFFHVYRLGQTPGWDPQEGYNLDIAWNLAHGRLRLFALTSAFAQHPPLFYLQLVALFRVFGYRIVAVRALSGAYALLTCAALLLVGRRLVGTAPALWAALAYTAAPLALANTRWGYTYAQLAFAGMLCLGAAWRYHREGTRGWLLVAALLAGLAAFSDYEGIAWVAFVALLALRRGWRESALALAAGLGVPLVGLLGCLVAAPAVFTGDVFSTAGRAAGGNLLLQGIELLVNYYRFLSVDVWVLLGVAGWFLISRPAVRGFVLLAVGLLGVTVLKVREVGTSFHTAVPLLPLLALGAGIALDLALRSLYGWTIHWLTPLLRPQADLALLAPPYHSAPRLAKLAATALVFVVVVSPVGLALASDVAGLGGTLATRQDAVLATPADAQAAAAFVRTHARAGDLVLASPELAWLFDHPDAAPQLQGADLLQALAEQGQEAAFYPAGLPASRWAYSVSLGHARFVVVDNLLRALARPDEIPSLAPLLATVSRWPAVYTRGQYVVYERPGGV